MQLVQDKKIRHTMIKLNAKFEGSTFGAVYTDLQRMQLKRTLLCLRYPIIMLRAHFICSKRT